MHYVKLAALLSAALLLGSCSSCSEATEGSNKNSANSNSNTKVVTPKKAKSAKPANSNANANVQMKKYPGMEEGKNPTLDPSKVKKVDMSKVQKGLPAKKMPDNSEIKTTMKGKYFLETRRFLNHPQLARLERLSKSAKDIEMTVVLRNGKEVKVANEKIKNYKTDSAASILRAAGVELEVQNRGEKKEK